MGLFCIMFNSDDKHMDPNEELLELLHHNLEKISAVIITIIMLERISKTNKYTRQNIKKRGKIYHPLGMQSSRNTTFCDSFTLCFYCCCENNSATSKNTRENSTLVITTATEEDP